MLAIVAAYLTFVGVGTFVMKRLPGDGFRFYGLSFVYNIVQVMLCSYMCIESFLIAYRQGYGFMPCVAYNQTNPPVANVLWLFYVSKILDFMDTFFIVVGKKWKQLSFLHVYHHTTIFLFYWLNINAGYDGDVFLTIILNGFIHTVMYTYYFVALHTKDIWWKQALTSSQLIQFVLMNLQAGYIVFTGCNEYPVRIVYVYGGYILSLIFLFGNFFIKNYIQTGSSKSASRGKKRN